ncbi:MAG TPA: hypothetical protein PLY80_06000 [Pseudomonadota bacterium]|nr:hypothetical protein [Pseudomonadota bacterium]
MHTLFRFGSLRRSRRFLPFCCSLWLSASGCAHSAKTTTTATVPPQTAAAPVQIKPQPPVAVIGTVPTNEEEAERVRQQLDTLSEQDETRLGRRQALIDYYCAATEQALLRGHAEDGFQLFSRALQLFDAAELQDPARPPTQPKLLAAAKSIDRTFSRRGAHPEAVVALMVQKTLNPTDPGPALRYQQLVDWLHGPGDQSPNAVRSRGRSLAQLINDPPPTLASDLELAYRQWPVPLIRKQLVEHYVRESQGSEMLSPRDFLQSLSQTMRRRGGNSATAFKLARLYLRVSQPKEALAEIEKLGKLSSEETRLADLLRDTLANPNPQLTDEQLSAAIKLAIGLAQNAEDIEVSLQVCRDVLVRAPQFVHAAVCIGELAAAMERKGLAVRALERAKALSPTDRTVWEKLGLLYVERLSDLVSEERTSEMEAALREIETYYGSMKQQFPETTPGLSMALALAEVGRGYFNAGSISEAARYLRRSVEVMPNAQALELLGMIHLRKGEAADAVAMLEKARAAHTSGAQFDPMSKEFYASRLGRLIGEAQDMGKEGAGAETRKQSLRRFDQLLVSGKLPPERRAEAEIERGKLYYQQGEREQSLLSFRLAADHLPSAEESNKNAGQLYADAIAFLVQRGELDLSLDIYHRALQSQNMGEPLKVYCSLWLTDLAQRAGQSPDPLATGFLQSVQGGKWHADLARFASGTLSDAELIRRADTPGKQAEASFYLAQAALRRGNRAQAMELWRKVVQSSMLGFFEYEMSNQYLRRGAPTQPLLSSKPQSPAAAPARRPTPASK